MSYYGGDDRPRRAKSTRERSRRDDYDGGTVYDENVRDTRIVRRRDDSVSSVEEVNRDFEPGGGYYRETTVRKSGHRPVRTKSDDDRWFDDRYDDSTLVSRRRRDDDYTVAAGRSRKDRDYDKRRRSRRRDDSYDSSSRSRTPPKKERRKSTTEEVLGALGLGGLAGQVLGKNRDRSRSSERSRHRSRSRAGGRRHSSSDTSRRRSKSRGKLRNEQVSQAIKAAVLAGAGEAFRSRKEPGSWGGDKGKRILTAALAAGGVDGLISNKNDPNHHNKRDIVGSALAGLATNRIVNGPRSKSRGRGGSSDRRGRSESRGGIADLAAGGVVAATAKKVYDSMRSRSRGRARSRSSSYDSRYDSPPRQKRSRSVSRVAAKGLAALGLKDTADKVDPDRRASSRHYDDYYDDGRSSRNGGYYNDSRDVGTTHSQTGHPNGGPRSMSLPRGHPPGYELDYGPRHTGDPDTDSDSDLGSSSDDEKQMKKGKKKMLLTGGLATVATIHAAHNVYQSMEKRDARRKALHEGDISKQEAKQEKNKARLQDVASIGIAALGLKGAYSEWREMKETNEERKEQAEKIERHKQKREARRRKMSMLASNDYANSNFTGSMPNLAAYGQDAYHPNGAPPFVSASDVHYTDDNPYGAMSQTAAHYAPAPPPPQPTGYPPPPIGTNYPTR
ncbi:hypothetical protein LTR47_007088 [Exophiala xenobiotica]|nr:hypothetical protein LTR47_007088 [Exophiala xenobiotica]KAK5252896.1 hypothetical protein LTS06_002608 [Exophiala xenobiotica]KAK5353772.1 hypothetical protein LTR61_002466 [Exophiala xenobiotica]KAK5366761.1 hypothetical protein LTS03_008674 [Exophiala xenobiotica]KAK5370581.1 hypothetical protein LTR11_006792 [Exophiala xenobiotica]